MTVDVRDRPSPYPAEFATSEAALSSRASSEPGPTGAALYAAALAGLPGMTPKFLRSLLREASPETVWNDLAGAAPAPLGDLTPAARRRLASSWSRAIERVCLASVQRRYLRAGVRVLLPGDPAFPRRLRDDRALPDRCEVLFARGDPRLAARPRTLAMVGTRRASAYGLRVARDLAAGAAAAGMVIVSGLALGIDGAAHAGALSVEGGAVLGVIGSGLDVPYPREHDRLTRQVAERGVVFTESPLGGAPRAENFPDRNRLLVNLAAVVVVVESPARGGSLITARLAAERGTTVMVVPGSIYAATSSGTNALLNEALPCRDLQDVEVAMGWATTAAPTGGGLVLDVTARRALDALGSGSLTIDELAPRSGVGVGALAVCLAELEVAGAVRRHGGRWIRVAR